MVSEFLLFTLKRIKETLDNGDVYSMCHKYEVNQLSKHNNLCKLILKKQFKWSFKKFYFSVLDGSWFTLNTEEYFKGPCGKSI